MAMLAERVDPLREHRAGVLVNPHRGLEQIDRLPRWAVSLHGEKVVNAIEGLRDSGFGGCVHVLGVPSCVSKLTPTSLPGTLATLERPGERLAGR